MSRRAAMEILGAAGVAGALVSGAREALAGEGSGEGSGEAAAPSLLRAGAVFGRWEIARVHPVDRGALRVDVRPRPAGTGPAGTGPAGTGPGDAPTFKLEILARDRSPLAPQPPALTEALAVYVCNGGDGFKATDEEQGLAAMTLAHQLAERGQGGAIAGLMTQAERLVAHADTLVRTPKVSP